MSKIVSACVHCTICQQLASKYFICQISLKIFFKNTLYNLSAILLIFLQKMFDLLCDLSDKEFNKSNYHIIVSNEDLRQLILALSLSPSTLPPVLAMEMFMDLFREDLLQPEYEGQETTVMRMATILSSWD